jgi:hypothetical protein
MDRRPDIVAAVGRMSSPDEVRREIQHLPEYLRAGESVQRLAAGVYGVGTGLLAVTDSRVIVLREGRAGQASEGFPFEQISGLDWAATTPEHATVTIRDTTRTTEFTRVAPADAAELVGFVRSVLQPPVAPAADPPAGAPGQPAGGSIGNKFTGPPAAVTPGSVPAGELAPPGERWTLGEVPVSQLVEATPEGVEAGAPAGRAPGAPVEATEPVSAVSAARATSAAAPADVPAEPSRTAAVEPAAEAAVAVEPAAQAVVAEAAVTGAVAAEAAVEGGPGAAADAGAVATRRPRFWRRTRARAEETPPPGA